MSNVFKINLQRYLGLKESGSKKILVYELGILDEDVYLRIPDDISSLPYSEFLIPVELSESDLLRLGTQLSVRRSYKKFLESLNNDLNLGDLESIFSESESRNSFYKMAIVFLIYLNYRASDLGDDRLSNTSRKELEPKVSKDIFSKGTDLNISVNISKDEVIGTLEYIDKYYKRSFKMRPDKMNYILGLSDKRV